MDLEQLLDGLYRHITELDISTNFTRIEKILCLQQINNLKNTMCELNKNYNLYVRKNEKCYLDFLINENTKEIECYIDNWNRYA